MLPDWLFKNSSIACMHMWGLDIGGKSKVKMPCTISLYFSFTFWAGVFEWTSPVTCFTDQQIRFLNSKCSNVYFVACWAANMFNNTAMQLIITGVDMKRDAFPANYIAKGHQGKMHMKASLFSVLSALLIAPLLLFHPCSLRVCSFIQLKCHLQFTGDAPPPMCYAALQCKHAASYWKSESPVSWFGS